MEIFDKWGTLLGEIEPTSEFSPGGCAVSLVLWIGGLIIFGPAVIAYYVVKKLTGTPSNRFSWAGFLVAIVMVPVWQVFIIGLMSSGTGYYDNGQFVPTSAAVSDVGTTSATYIRSGPGEEYPAVDHLGSGQLVLPTGQTSNGWVEISDPEQGWVDGDYLR